MSKLYYNMINIDRELHLPCWKIYMDLIETQHNPEPVDFYDWDLIESHPNAYDLPIYKKNMNECINKIVTLVESIVCDITNSSQYYKIVNTDIIIDMTTCFQVIDMNNSVDTRDQLSPYVMLDKNEMITCDFCGNMWDGCAQCDCNM